MEIDGGAFCNLEKSIGYTLIQLNTPPPHPPRSIVDFHTRNSIYLSTLLEIFKSLKFSIIDRKNKRENLLSFEMMEKLWLELPESEIIQYFCNYCFALANS